MQAGEHDWPEEFRDEDKWVFLTKRQWIIIGIGVLIGAGIVGLFYLLGLGAIVQIAFILAALVFIAAVLTAFIPMPERFYLFGGGVRLEILLFRLIKHKWKGSRVIWTANLDNGCEEWGEGAKRVKEARKRKESGAAASAHREKLPWE